METLIGLLIFGVLGIIVIGGAIIALLAFVYGIHAICDKLGID